MALTGLLAIAAAPWVHTYDMIPLSVAVVVLAATTCRRSLALLGFAWFWPGAVVLLPIPLPLSAASIAAVAWLVWRGVADQTVGLPGANTGRYVGRVIEFDRLVP